MSESGFIGRKHNINKFFDRYLCLKFQQITDQITRFAKAQFFPEPWTGNPDTGLFLVYEYGDLLWTHIQP